MGEIEEEYMIDTKEQYEKQMEVIEEYLGTPGVDARETIEALREVAREANSIYRDDGGATLTLAEALDALPDWLTE